MIYILKLSSLVSLVLMIFSGFKNMNNREKVISRLKEKHSEKFTQFGKPVIRYWGTNPLQPYPEFIFDGKIDYVRYREFKEFLRSGNNLGDEEFGNLVKNYLIWKKIFFVIFFITIILIFLTVLISIYSTIQMIDNSGI